MTDPITPEKTDTRDDIERALDTIAGILRGLVAQQATGELAALKRLDWRQPSALAFARLTTSKAVEALLPADHDNSETLRRLAAIASEMAAANELHAGWSLGRALADIGASEQRLGALLTARADALIDQVKRTAHRLGREGPLPYRQIGKLLLADLLDPVAAEDLRFQIARDYARSTRASARSA
jgi:hypothetical protein